MVVDLEIVYTDSYIIPNEMGNAIFDVVFKNNTANTIEVGISYQYSNGGGSGSFSGNCIPPFATSGYYVLTSMKIVNRPSPLVLTVYPCIYQTKCPSYACNWQTPLVGGSIPMPRLVTTIPTEAEVLTRAGLTMPPLPQCIPNWVCDKPLNGYEKDGCGGRRLNSACNPIIAPPVEICVSTGFNCEIPLNGYEKDNCGTRRLNPVCNPVVEPPIVPPEKSSMGGILLIGLGIGALYLLMRKK